MFTNVQRPLSRFQAYPIIGFSIGSPIKLAVSLVEIVAGAIVALLAALVYYPSAILFRSPALQEWLSARIQGGLENVELGMASGLYSVVNLVTFGVVGAVAELCECLFEDVIRARK